MHDKAWRIAGAAGMAALLAALLATSPSAAYLATHRDLADATAAGPLLASFDALAGGWPWGAVLVVCIGLAVLGSALGALRRGTHLGFTVLCVLLATYILAHIEWTRVVLHKGIATGGMPGLGLLLLMALALAAAGFLTLAGPWRAAERDYLARGVDPAEARAARGMMGFAAAASGLAVLGALLVALAFGHAGELGDWRSVTLALGPFLFPLLAGLGFLALVLLAARPRAAPRRANPRASRAGRVRARRS